jgi:hypothetical protein
MCLAAEMVPAAFSISIAQWPGPIKLPYSPEFIADLDRTMSQARLSRYLTAAAGDIDSALALYEKNVLLSEALFGFLHGLEVTVRNSMHFVFSGDLRTADWYQDGLALPWLPPTRRRLSMTRSMRGMIEDARAKAGPTAPVGKVIAELTFGFWPAMIGNRFDDIWRKSLYKAFPHTRERRQIVHWRLDTIRFLRNRIAHHEPILSSTNEIYTGHLAQPKISLPAILQCVEWVSPPTADWLRTTTRYEQALTILAEVVGSGLTL